MAVHWPNISQTGGNIPEEAQKAIRGVVDEFGVVVAQRLAGLRLPVHASPFFRPFSLVVVRDASQVLVGCSPAVSIAELQWLEQPGKTLPASAMVDFVRNQRGRELSAVVSLPLPEAPNRTALVEAAASAHVKEVETMHTLGKLGDIRHVRHLEPYLRTFLQDHPEPARNVFLMMRFSDTPQMQAIHASIRSALANQGMNAIRADDRDYTGELWSNIEVYLTGCQYGIAVFEDIDKRDFNPNVSLELGYMMGRGKRTLLLKEKRLPSLPSDVVHRLYKVFDIFDIENSIKREIDRWVSVDLGLKLEAQPRH